MISATRVGALAQNTMREAIRNRILYLLLFFALVMIGTGVVLASLSYVEQERILQDVGLAAIRLFGAALAVFLGVGLLHKEVERRTIYTILSKPVTRAEFVLGKYAGLVATLWLQVAVMALAFAAISAAAGAPVGAGHAVAVALTAVELALLVAVATLFSAFTSPLLASCFSAGIYLVGHLSRDVRELGARSGSEAVQAVTLWIHRLLPDLESFNWTVQAVHGLPIPPGEIGLALAYGVAYTGLLLFGAVLLFERRDFR